MFEDLIDKLPEIILAVIGVMSILANVRLVQANRQVNKDKGELKLALSKEQTERADIQAQANQTQGLLQVLSEQTTNIGKMADNVGRLADNVEQAHKTYEKGLQAYGEGLQRIQSLLESNNRVQEVTQGELNKLGTKVVGVSLANQDMASEFQTLSKNIRELLSSLKEQDGKREQRFDSYIGKLDSVVGRLNPLVDKVECLTQEMETVNTPILESAIPSPADDNEQPIAKTVKQTKDENDANQTV